MNREGETITTRSKPAIKARHAAPPEPTPVPNQGRPTAHHVGGPTQSTRDNRVLPDYKTTPRSPPQTLAPPKLQEREGQKDRFAPRSSSPRVPIVEMAAMKRLPIGVLAVVAMIFAIALPAVQAQAPAPAPTSDGTSVDQGVAYVLMLVALVLTYLIHPLDAWSPIKLF